MAGQQFRFAVRLTLHPWLQVDLLRPLNEAGQLEYMRMGLSRDHQVREAGCCRQGVQPGTVFTNTLS